MVRALSKDNEKKDYNEAETEFAVFCIENVAERLEVDSERIYDAFTRDSDILETYIIPCFDILHTQGKEYIVNDLIDLMKERGIEL